MKDLDLIDPVDVDHLQQVLNSRGYQLIRERLEREETNIIKELTTDLEMPATTNRRGRLSGIRRALAIPMELVRELKEPRHSGGK